jgi:tetratricopeptide (TPR) repeat protein
MMHVEKAIKIESSNPEYFNILGDIYQKLGLFDKALNSYYNSAKLEPNDYEVWMDIAELHEDNNSIQDAIDALNEGITQASLVSELYFKLAELYVKNSELQEAYEAFALGLTNNPTDINSIMTDYPVFAQHFEFQQLLNIYFENLNE